MKKLQTSNLIYNPNLNESDDDNILQLTPIVIDEDYRKKWNIRMNDFVCLTKNHELVNDSLYRISGVRVNLKEDYFMLLKHNETYYSDEITKIKKDKPHLESKFCIIDKNGIEKVIFGEFEIPYIINGSQIYFVNNKFYNIESGEFYCNSGHFMQSSDFIFIENKYDKDKSKCGIIKIDKKDGSWELFV